MGRRKKLREAQARKGLEEKTAKEENFYFYFYFRKEWERESKVRGKGQKCVLLLLHKTLEEGHYQRYKA